MKLKNVLLGASMLTVMGIVATSCTNEMVNPLPGGHSNGKSSMLVQEPDIYAWSGKENLTSTRGFTRAGEEGNDYFSFETVTDDWVDSFKRNDGASGPQNIVNILKYGIDEWLDLDIETWVKDEWITQKNSYNSWGEVKMPAPFPNNINGQDAIDKLNTDIGLSFTAGSTYTFYPYLTGETDQSFKEIGLYWYDAQGNIQKQIVWNAEINGYNNGKIDGIKLTFKKDCVMGMYFSGRANNSNVNNTYYFTDPTLNKTDTNNDDDFKNFTIHAGFVPQESLAFYNGSVLLVEDWNDYDFDDFMIFFKEVVTNTSSEDVRDGVDDDTTVTPEQPEDKCPGRVTPGHYCEHPESDHNPDGTCPKCDEEGHGPCMTPEQPENNCPQCGHPEHGYENGDPCDQCNSPEDGCYHESESHDPVVPTDKINFHNDEVEVNYSINDVHTDKNGQKYAEADLWTKLSIHVRKGTDVRIHVPLPGRYFCESDDFAILQNHYNGIYTGTLGAAETPGAWNEDGTLYSHSMDYTIRSAEKTWTVTLTVTIDDNGMDITTNGIDQELIDYLFEVNGDGINFELWNYYQTETISWNENGKELEHGVVKSTLTEAEYAAFQGYLDRSTIEFLDSDPSYYINAYGYEWENGKFTTERRKKDCRVTPAMLNDINTVHTGFTMNQYYCYHLNGTPWNIIWVNNNVDKTSDCYKAHTTSPKPGVEILPVTSTTPAE